MKTLKKLASYIMLAASLLSLLLMCGEYNGNDFTEWFCHMIWWGGCTAAFGYLYWVLDTDFVHNQKKQS